MKSIITETIIQNMSIGALVINPQGAIVVVNKAAADILGYPTETIIENGWGPLLFKNQANDAFNQVLLDVIWQEPVTFHRKVSYIPPNGKVMHLSITSSFLRENKDVVGIVVLLDNITEIHDLHLKEKAWLEEKNRLMQEKAAGLFQLSLAVAHQLRNPTAAIGGLAKLIQKKSADEKIVHDYSQQILTCATRLTEIVKAVEDYTAIPPIHPCYFPVEQFFAEMHLFVTQLAAARRHRVTCLCESQPLKILADPKLLNVALQELLKNAVENLSSDGTINLSLLTHYNQCIIKITDNGCGIEAENLPFIFDPFFTTKVMGVGMGLCIAKKIIGEHGGRLTIAGRSGGGTVAQIELPHH